MIISVSFSASLCSSLGMNELTIKQNNANGPVPSSHTALAGLRLYLASLLSAYVLPASPIQSLSYMSIIHLSDLMKMV